MKGQTCDARSKLLKNLNWRDDFRNNWKSYFKAHPNTNLHPRHTSLEQWVSSAGSSWTMMKTTCINIARIAKPTARFSWIFIFPFSSQFCHLQQQPAWFEKLWWTSAKSGSFCWQEIHFVLIFACHINLNTHKQTDSHPRLRHWLKVGSKTN